jgi:hypothetical protein
MTRSSISESTERRALPHNGADRSAPSNPANWWRPVLVLTVIYDWRPVRSGMDGGSIVDQRRRRKELTRPPVDRLGEEAAKLRP